MVEILARVEAELGLRIGPIAVVPVGRGEQGVAVGRALRPSGRR
jgi:hypothetical protein